MSDWKIIEAKNVELAVKRAAEQFGIDNDKIEYEIVSHGSSGIFGLVGVKKAKIKVHLSAAKLASPAGSPSGTVSARDLAKMKVDALAAEIDGIPKSEAAQENEKPLGNAIVQSADFAKAIIEKIIGNFDDGYTVSYTTQKGRIHYNINGKEVGLLIGKRGKTIEALQYLTEKILYQKEGKRVPISLEVENYLQRKEAKIQKIAEDVAKKVKKDGKPVTLGKMNAKERKIVHLFLKKDQKVRTQSIGEGYMKKMVVFPKKGKKPTRPASKNTAVP